MRAFDHSTSRVMYEVAVKTETKDEHRWKGKADINGSQQTEHVFVKMTRALATLT